MTTFLHGQAGKQLKSTLVISKNGNILAYYLDEHGEFKEGSITTGGTKVVSQSLFTTYSGVAGSNIENADLVSSTSRFCIFKVK